MRSLSPRTPELIAKLREVYTIHSLAELKNLTQPINYPEIQITIWKNRKQADFEADESGTLDALASDLKWIYFLGSENRNESESYAIHPDKYANNLNHMLS